MNIGTKIALTGLMFSIFLIVPGLLRDREPPYWAKLIILILGFGGAMMAFFGSIAAVWL